ncbi:MAG: hypothetical protein M1838_003072 [Thelocarpon superellum]|nr:MAG: hypothetical protein M1838_003072 [Thelocarpon superellum]
MTHNILTVLLFVTAVWGHMQLVYPPPFGGANNPHRTDPADEYLQYPFNCCGRTTPFPCGGYLRLLGTRQGASVATWTAGSVQNWNISGIGNHWGGSCQVGFSIDQGKSFQVATSYEGNCPHRSGGEDASGQTFNFTVPADIPAGDVVFAWTWFNREQEFNMNCAAVTITNETTTTDPTSPAGSYSAMAALAHTYSADGCQCTCPPTQPALRALLHHRHAGGREVHMRKRTVMSYGQRPAMLIADTGNGCATPHTTAEVKYPNPGPDVVPGDGVYPLEMPTPPEKCGY